MSWSYRNANGTEVAMNFVAPAGAENLTREVLFPLVEKQTPDYATVLAVDVMQTNTILQPAILTGNATINLTIDAQVTKGARLVIKLSTGATKRTVTLGTGFDESATSVAVPKNGTVFLSFTYDGVSFVPDSTADVGLGELDARMDVLEASEVQTPAYGATLAVNVAKKETFLQPAELTGNTTINLTIDAALPVGSKLHLKLDADGTNRTVTLGTGFDAGLASVVVAATKVAFVTFTYDGTAFVPAYSVPATA